MNKKAAKTVLHGHTGSYNHGCEAIVRSTATLLKNEGLDCDVATYRADEDRKFGINKLGNLIEYRSYNGRQKVARLVNGIMKKVFHYEYPYEAFIQKDVFDAVKQCGSVVVIGGDTYCYGRGPCVPSYNLLKFSKRNGVKAVLWSCSIGKEDLEPEKISYLKRYDMIFPRECVTYKNLLDAGVPEEKLHLMSDSAFVLPAKETRLPEGFSNVLAYNPSFTLGRATNNREQLFESRITLLKYLLNNTDMMIALIPHVYSENYGDAHTCRELAQRLNCPERVVLFDREYTCEELKYIISKCRMLVAERTHASIAGYSQQVPTFVIGYSVKSIGIARDLFGTEEGYVMSYKNIKNDEDLIRPIMDFVSRENEIRLQLEKVIPAYKQRPVMAAKRLAELLE